DQPLENLLSAWRCQIERDAALVAVGQGPLIGILGVRLVRELIAYSPEVAGRRLHFDDVGAEIGQDRRRAGSGDEARKVHDFQPGEDVVICHWSLLSRSCS